MVVTPGNGLLLSETMPPQKSLAISGVCAEGETDGNSSDSLALFSLSPAPFLAGF
jgi:hypothetical protein